MQVQLDSGRSRAHLVHRRISVHACSKGAGPQAGLSPQLCWHSCSCCGWSFSCPLLRRFVASTAGQMEGCLGKGSGSGRFDARHGPGLLAELGPQAAMQAYVTNPAAATHIQKQTPGCNATTSAMLHGQCPQNLQPATGVWLGSRHSPLHQRSAAAATPGDPTPDDYRGTETGPTQPATHRSSLRSGWWRSLGAAPAVGASAPAFEACAKHARHETVASLCVRSWPGQAAPAKERPCAVSPRPACTT